MSWCEETLGSRCCLFTEVVAYKLTAPNAHSWLCVCSAPSSAHGRAGRQTVRQPRSRALKQRGGAQPRPRPGPPPSQPRGLAGGVQWFSVPEIL